MRPVPYSPFHPCARPESHTASAHQTLGWTTDPANSQSGYSELTAELLFERALAALEVGQAKSFFDEKQHSYEYDSRSMGRERAHRPLPENPTNSITLSSIFHYINKGSRLRFLDLLCPFPSPLIMLRTLKQEMSDHDEQRVINKMLWARLD